MKNRKLLAQLFKLPQNVLIERILFFYKADLIMKGLEGNTGLLDEFTAGVILKTFTDLEAKYNASSKNEQAKLVSEMFNHLDNWRNFSNYIQLFSYIWLLHKKNKIPTDKFNGIVVMTNGGSNIIYCFDLYAA